MKKIIKITVAMIMVLSLMLTLNLNVFAGFHMSSWEYCDIGTMFENYGTRATTHFDASGVSTDAQINEAGYTYELYAYTEITCDNIWYYADPYQHRISSSDIVGIYGDVTDSYRRNVTSVRSSWSPMPIDSEEVLMHSYGKTWAIFSNYVWDDSTDSYTVIEDAHIHTHQIHDTSNHSSSKCEICKKYPYI